MSTLKRIAKNTAIVFFGNNALKVLSMILVFLIARMLGDAEYGKFSFVLSFTGLFFILMDLGTRILIVREIAQNRNKASKIVSNVLILKTLTSVFVYGLVILTAFLLKYEVQLILGIALAALGIVFDSFAITFESIFQSYERMEFPTGTKIMRILVRFAITVPLLFSGVGFFPVLIVFVLVQFLNFIVSLILCFRFFVKPVFDFDKKYILDLVKRAFPFLLSGIFVTVYFRIDITLMSKLAPVILKGVYANASRDAIIGWYSAAYNILDGLTSIPVAVSAAILPVAIVYFKESREKLIRLYTLSVKYLTYVSIPSAIGITLLADKLIIMIYKNEYINAAPALKILVWTMVPLCINYMLGAMMIATHNEKKSLYVLFGNCLVNILCNIILIPRLSLYGAALATFLSELFYFSGYYYIVSKSLVRLNILKFMTKPLISGLAMAGLIYYLNYMNVFILIILGASIYFALMFLLRAFSREDILLIKRLFKQRI